MKNRNLVFVCAVVSLAFMILPFSVAMSFATNSADEYILYYSHFSLMPIGYGNYLPVLSAILTSVSIVFILLKKDVVTRVLLGLSIVFIILSWVIFSSFTIVSAAILVIQIEGLILNIKKAM